MINIDINAIAFLNVRWYGIMIALAIAIPWLVLRTRWVKAGEKGEGE